MNTDVRKAVLRRGPTTNSFWRVQILLRSACVCVLGRAEVGVLSVSQWGVWVQASSRLTCAVQPRGLQGRCSLSANPNKAQTEPQRGMLAVLLMAGVEHATPGCACLFADTFQCVQWRLLM